LSFKALKASMSDNVIPFRVLTVQSASRGNGQIDPRLVEKRIRAFELKRLGEIHDQYKRKSDAGILRWLTDEDRLRAALALGRLVQADGVPLAVLKNNWREKHRSELRIHRYMLPPNTDLADRQTSDRAAAKIWIRKVEPYATRARFIAEQNGRDPDQSEIALFRDTSLWRKNSRRDDTDDGSRIAADRVSFQIQEQCDRLSRDLRLAHLFKKMGHSAGRWNIENETFAPSTTMCLLEGAYRGGIEERLYAPPFPSVPLVLLPHAVLKFQAQVYPLERDTAVPLSTSPEAKGEWNVEVHIFRQIRLAIGLTVNAATVGPLFESRVCSIAKFRSERFPSWKVGPLNFDSNWSDLSALGPERPFTVSVDADQYEIRPLVELKQFAPSYEPAPGSDEPADSPFLWCTDPLVHDNESAMWNGYVSWTSVDAEHVSLWLDRYRDWPSRGDSCPVDQLPDAGQADRVHCETWFPEPLLAYYVERALYDGRLRSALESAIKRLTEAFSVYDAERRARLEEQTKDFVAECRNDTLLPGRPTTTST
jgi:hypothetical protein